MEGMLPLVDPMQARLGQATPSEDPASPIPASPGSLWWLLVVGLAAALLCMPFVRTVYLDADEGVFLHAAERMLRGQRLYADFFEFLPPGSFVLTAAWFGLTGISMVAARSLAILTIVGIASFTFLACRRASSNAPLSALLTIGWVVMSQGVWTQVSHHWFTTLISMVAIWAALGGVQDVPGRFRWPLIAGIAAGTAVMVTPTRGALVMLAALTVFLGRRRIRTELIVYLLGAALAPIGLFAYVIEQDILAPAFNDVIHFTTERYASIQGVPFGYQAALQNFPLLYLFPLAALLAMAVSARDWRAAFRDHPLRICAVFGLAGFVGCYPRPDIGHISITAPLACPLLACCATRLTRSWRPVYRHAAAGVAIGLCAPSALAFSRISEEAVRAEIVSTPRGGVVFVGLPDQRSLMARIAMTPYGQAYFFYPFMPLLPFLTAREHVSKYDVFVPGYTAPSQYREACISAIRHASWVVIDRRWTDRDFLRRNFPAMRDTEPQEIKRFDQALADSFELVVQEGPYELRSGRQGLSDTACAEIRAE